jgi:hypothetical protein
VRERTLECFSVTAVSRREEKSGLSVGRQAARMAVLSSTLLELVDSCAGDTKYLLLPNIKCVVAIIEC